MSKLWGDVHVRRALRLCAGLAVRWIERRKVFNFYKRCEFYIDRSAISDIIIRVLWQRQ